MPQAYTKAMNLFVDFKSSLQCHYYESHIVCICVETIEYVIQHKLMKLFGFNTNAVALLLHLFHSLAVNCVLNCLR